jgi:glycosyltransferase involved in cell wall biosynthesis
MNVLFLVPSLGLGGAEKQLVIWADILQRDFGMRVAVACFDPLRIQRLASLRDLDVSTLVVERNQSALARMGRVVSFARQSRTDVVHAFSFYLSPVAVAAATAAGARPAASFQGDGVSDLMGSPLRRLSGLRLIKYFTSNSREAMSRIKPRLRSGSFLQYVPNLVASPPESPRHPRHDGNDVVALVVARLDDNKRVHVFLDALAAARKQQPKLRGVIVGDGPARETLMQHAGQLGLLPHAAEFAGLVPDPSEKYATADIFVHLAISEGTPNVVLEAMAAGLPVVATPAGEVRRLIRPGHNGLLVPFDDAASVAGCLVDLAGAPDQRDRLGEQGRTEVLAEYSMQRVRDSLERFYSVILAG